MAATLVLEASAARRVGSSPTQGTNLKRVSVMAARESHKLEDRFDSETTQPV